MFLLSSPFPPIYTDEGQKPSEEIEVGDKVLSEEPETGEQGYFEVVAITSHAVDEVLQVTLDVEAEDSDNDEQQLNTDTMEVTPEHPVYVEGKGWLWAENLSIGDRLRRADGGMAKVLAIERRELDEAQVVYNFTVKGPHTYFVLEAGVLVHNAGGVHCILVESGNPWRDEQGRFARPPDFDEEMGVFTRKELSPNPDLSGKTIDRPIAFRNPATNRIEPLPNVLRITENGISPEVRWSQQLVNKEVGWQIGPNHWEKIPIPKAVENLQDAARSADESLYKGQLLVFRKTEAMNNWPMTYFPANNRGEIYLGDWEKLQDELIYSINNRTFTTAILAQADGQIEHLDIPLTWASRQEIQFYSYQYSAIKQGSVAKLNWLDDGHIWVGLDGRPFRDTGLSEQAANLPDISAVRNLLEAWGYRNYEDFKQALR